MYYPRFNIALIVTVIRDQNQLLVTKYTHSLYNRYTLVTGYIEIGGTIEETVIRDLLTRISVEFKK